MSKFLISALAAIALFAQPFPGAAAEPWDGSRVFPASADIQARTATGMVLWIKEIPVPLVVASEKSGELTVEYEGTKYTVHASDVVLANDAEKHYQAMLAKQPTSFAHRMLGFVYNSEADFDRAIASFTEAIRLEPKFAELYYDRAYTRQNKGDQDKAIADYSEAIRLKPDYANAYYNRGGAWYEKGEYDKAIADCSEAIRIDPQDADAYYSRANTWCEKNEYDKAIADYSKAIQLDPNDADAFYSRANAWIDKGDYDKAIADYSDAIRLQPKDAEFYYWRGEAWLLKGDKPKAIDDFSSAIDKGLDDTDMYLRRAGLLWSIGEKQRASADLDEVIRRAPADEHVRVTCAHFRYGHGEYDKAIVECEEAIRLEAQLFPYPYVVRGASLCVKGEYEKAIADMKRAIEIAPHLPSPYAALAGIASICEDAKFRDGKKAVEYATKGCELTLWKDPFQLGILAAAYAESGDFPSAVKYQEQAIGLLKDFPSGLPRANARLELYKQQRPYRGKMATDVVPSEKL